MKKIIEINMENIDKEIKLISNVNYDDFEDIHDLKNFHTQIYQQLIIVKTSLSTYYNDKPSKTEIINEMSRTNQADISSQEYRDFFGD